MSQKDADDYLKALDDAMNNRKGMSEALVYISSLEENGYGLDDELSAMLNGFKDGTISFFEGIGKFFNPSGVRTVQDYIMYYKVALLSDPEKYGLNIKLSPVEKEMLKATYNIFNGAGHMFIPQIISLSGVTLSAFTGNPTIASIFQKVSSVLLATSVAGSSANEAVANGNDLLHSYLYGLLSGASEVVFEKIGGILGIGKDVNLLSLSGKEFIKGYVYSMFKEGREEFFQEYFDAAIRTIILGEPLDLTNTTKDALIAGLYGMSVAGVMNSYTIPIKIGGKIINVAYGDLANLDLENLTGEQLILKLEELKTTLFAFSETDQNIINNIIEKYKSKIPSNLTSIDEKLSFLIRNGYLVDKYGNITLDFDDLGYLDSIKEIKNNPGKLFDLYKELSDIYKKIKQNPNMAQDVLNSSNFEHIVNILYILASDPSFRNSQQTVDGKGTTIKKILKNLSCGILAIGTDKMLSNSSVYELVINDKGDTIKVNVVGNDIDSLQQQLNDLKKQIDMLPPELKQCLTELDSFIFTDDYGYSGLLALMKGQNDLRSLALPTGSYTIADNSIKIFDINTLAHELGHKLDHKLCEMFNKSDDYITNTLWKQVINEENSSVSEYGNTSIQEDFADSMKEYAKNPEDFKKKHPKRYEMIKRMFQMADPDANLKTVEETEELIEFLEKNGLDSTIYREHLEKIKNKNY